MKRLDIERLQIVSEAVDGQCEHEGLTVEWEHCYSDDTPYMMEVYDYRLKHGGPYLFTRFYACKPAQADLDDLLRSVYDEIRGMIEASKSQIAELEQWLTEHGEWEEE